MSEIATNMVETVINGLINATVEGFDQISDMDSILDEGLHDGMDTIINFMESCPESVDVCSYYLFMMRYMERVGDHACKIAEKVTFMVTGVHTVIG